MFWIPPILFTFQFHLTHGYKSKLFITSINDFHRLLKDLSNQKEYFLGFFICNTEVPFLNKQALDPFCKPSLPFSPILHSIFYHHWIIDGWITFRKGHMIVGGIWEEKMQNIYILAHARPQCIELVCPLIMITRSLSIALQGVSLRTRTFQRHVADHSICPKY